MAIIESFINRYVNHYLVINMGEKAHSLKENDKGLVEEIKRIKKLQKGLYKEYEIPGLEDIEDVD